MKKIILSIFTAGMLFNVASISDTCAMSYESPYFSSQYLQSAYDMACEGKAESTEDFLRTFGKSLITSDPENDEEIPVDMFVSYVDELINKQLKSENVCILTKEYVKYVLNKTVIDTTILEGFKSKKLVDPHNIIVDKDAREYIFYRIMNFAASNNINLADISRTLAEYQKDRFFRGKLSRCNDITNLYLSGNLAGVITETNNRIANFFDVQPSIVEQTPGLFSRLFSGWFS